MSNQVIDQQEPETPCMTAVGGPVFIPENIPTELKSWPQWVPWELREVPGKKKPQKVPRRWNGTSFDNCNAGAPTSWVSFDTAVDQAASGASGVGFCTKDVGDENWKLVVLDLDNVGDRAVTGVDLYQERSPSGNGIRSAFWLPQQHSAVTVGKAYIKLRWGDGSPAGELYVHGGYTTWTGDLISPGTVPMLQELPYGLVVAASGTPEGAPMQGVAWGQHPPLTVEGLTGATLEVFNGAGKAEGYDRSSIMLPLLATLSWQCETVEELVARAWSTEHLQVYFSDHRVGSSDQAQKFCTSECAKAWAIRNIHAPVAARFGLTTKSAVAPGTPPHAPPPAQLEEWDEPLDLFAISDVDLPAFDDRHWPYAVAVAAMEMGERKSCDPVISATAGMAALSSLITDSYRLKLKEHDDWHEPARLWFMIVGEPGRKKSPGSAPMFKPLEDIQERLDRTHREGKSIAEKLNIEFHEHRLRLMLSDVTIEGLTERVAQFQPGGIFLHFDEGSEFFGGMDAYRSGGAKKDRGFYLKGWTGGRYERVRVSTGDTVVENLSIKLYANVQPDVLRRLVQGSAEDGLLPRFLPVIPQPGGPVHDRKVIGAQFSLYVATMQLLYENFQYQHERVSFTMTGDARAQLLELITKAERRVQMGLVYGKRMRLWLEKAGSQLGRLVLATHILDDVTRSAVRGHPYTPNLTVGVDTVDKVGNLFFCCLVPMAERFYAQLGEQSDPEEALKVAASLLTDNLRDKTQVTARDVYRENRWLDAGDKKGTHDIMEHLSFAGWVRPKRRGNQAHPNVFELWEVNPKIHARFARRAQEEQRRRREGHQLLMEKLGSPA